MNNSRVRAAVAALFLCGSAALAAPEEKQETIRPEIGKPLQAAQELIKAKKGREALAKIGEADAVANKTPFEAFVVERVRASAAVTAGDVGTAVKSLEAVIATGRLAPEERLPMMQGLASSYYNEKDYAKAIAWAARYYKEGGTGRDTRLLLTHAYYQNGEYENAAQEALADIDADEKAGAKPAENQLLLLVSSYRKLKDDTRYLFALEKLVTYYPKKDYWSDLLAHAQKNPHFANRLSLDMQRLRLAVGLMESAEDYLELAQTALTAGYPTESKSVMDKGYAAGVLGTGPAADRHKRMRDLVEKKVAEDHRDMANPKTVSTADAQKDSGLQLVTLGYAFVTDGQYDKGLSLMERGFDKGAGQETDRNKRPQDNKLHLGIAYLAAGKKERAIEVLRQVRGVHGAADMARLWIIHANQS